MPQAIITPFVIRNYINKDFFFFFINIYSIKNYILFKILKKKNLTKIFDIKIQKSNSFSQSKGFPDVNTRLFLRKLTDHLNLPVYALVDADPYGIEIMCVYRYGSLVRKSTNKLVPTAHLVPTNLL